MTKPDTDTVIKTATKPETERETEPETERETERETRAMVARLRETFESGRTRALSWRLEQLVGLQRMMVDAAEEFAAALHDDLRRPGVEAFTADIGHTKGELRHLQRHLGSWMKPRRVRVPLTTRPGRAEVVAEPLGVALVIAPWNYPIQLLVEPMAAALAAGNCVVAKPSELAPACSAALARLIPRYVDPSAVSVVEGGIGTTTGLLAQRWDHIFFTGSTAVGRIVAQAAAQNLTPTTLELGGKSPTYVHTSANLEVSARRIVWGKFFNAGQTCIAPDYVLVDREIRDRLVHQLSTEITRFYGTDPRQSPSYGRIINHHHFDRLSELVEGAVIASGGGTDRAERFFEPTVMVEPAPDSAVMTEEIFGPILPVLAVDGAEAAAAFIAARPKPLALYLFTEDNAVVQTVLTRTSSGGVCVNHTLLHLVPPNLPFGGVGDSGMGAYHGKTGFDTFSHHRSVLRKPSRPDLKLMYPPYGTLIERLTRKIL